MIAAQQNGTLDLRSRLNEAESAAAIDNERQMAKLGQLVSRENSNMTWFFSPIKSTDTNSALLADIKPPFPIQPVITVFPERESPFRQSVLLSVFWVPWVKLGNY